jgi:hypothetical protein
MNKWYSLALVTTGSVWMIGCTGGALEAKEAWPTVLVAKAAAKTGGTKQEKTPVVYRPRVPLSPDWATADAQVPREVGKDWTQQRYRETTSYAERARNLKLAEIDGLIRRHQVELKYWQGVVERGVLDEQSWRQHVQQAMELQAIEESHLATINAKMATEPSKELEEIQAKKTGIKAKFDQAIQNFKLAADHTASEREIAEDVVENIGLILADLEAEKMLWRSYYGRVLSEVSHYAIADKARPYQGRTR